jgi:predicted glycosyltransferase
MSSSKTQKIWIDLDNSPHVPFFRPIIKELDKQGIKVVVTARDCFQVIGLAELFGLRYKKIGRHYGEKKILKIIGTIYRSLQLLPNAIHEKPSLSVSHGSRSQLIAAFLLGIPTVVIRDYEHSKGVGFISPKWTIIPEAISNNAKSLNEERILSYPGLKEDVYVFDYRPNPEIKKKLGLRERNIVVTIRPPATEAHYHNPESEKLFIATVDFLASVKNVCLVILPRNEIKQKRFVKKRWATECKSGKIIVPDFVVNGLDLIWYSDFVISGGGTMNREAAALGVPVYSIFRGKIGAVDQYLSDSGRLTLIKSVEEIERKIKIAKRLRLENPEYGNRDTIEKITNHIVTLIEKI